MEVNTVLHRSIIASFIENNVEFILIGGMAVRCYNPDRNTQDMDLLINNSKRNASNIAESLISITEVDFDQKVVKRFIDTFKNIKQLFKLNEGSTLTDLMTPVSEEFDFDLILRGSEKRLIFDFPVHVASPTDLIKMLKVTLDNQSESNEYDKLNKLKYDIQFLKEYTSK